MTEHNTNGNGSICYQNALNFTLEMCEKHKPETRVSERYKPGFRSGLAKWTSFPGPRVFQNQSFNPYADTLTHDTVYIRLVVLESGLGLESIFAGLGLGLGLELKGLGLGLGLATYGLGLGLGLCSFFSKSFFKSTLQSVPVERVFSHGGIVNFASSHSSTVICCTWE